jgi:hypothetical protein
MTINIRERKEYDRKDDRHYGERKEKFEKSWNEKKLSMQKEESHKSMEDGPAHEVKEAEQS